MITPEYIADVLTLDLQTLQAKYKQLGDPTKPKIKDERSLTNLRRQYRKKLNEMESLPHNPENEELERLAKVKELLEGAGIELGSLPSNAEVSFHIGYMKGPDGEFEYTKPLPSIRFKATEKPEDLAEVFTPAEAANITPTSKERPARDSKLILVYGDGQVDYRRIINPVTQEQELVPLHDEAMLRVIQQFNAEFQPETTVNLGDFADMSALSRFDPDSDHFHKTLGPSMQFIHNFYAQMRADNPDSLHVEVDSNHAARPKKAVLKNLPALYDFYLPGEDYPLLSYYRLANLGKLGIQFYSGYGAAEFVYGEEYDNPIVFKHGTHSSSTPGSTVSKESKENPEVNIVRGHGHHDEEVRRTTRSGKQLFYKMLGSSCLNNGPVPGYDSAIDDFNRPVKKHTNHQNTFAVIEDFQNGHYTMTTIDVIDGRAYYQGKEYDGNE